MRRTSIILASAVLLLAGCGDDDGDQGQTVETTTTEGHDGSTTGSGDVELSEVVVQLDDLPAGWSVFPSEGEGEPDDEICEGHDPYNEIEAQDEAESVFQQSELGQFVTSLAAQFTDDGEAGEVMAQLSEAANACQSFTETDEDGIETAYTIAPLPFPDLGDETVAFRLSATTAYGPIALDYASVREGEFTLSVINGGFGPPDTALTESLAQTMLDRL